MCAYGLSHPLSNTYSPILKVYRYCQQVTFSVEKATYNLALLGPFHVAIIVVYDSLLLSLFSTPSSKDAFFSDKAMHIDKSSKCLTNVLFPL